MKETLLGAPCAHPIVKMHAFARMCLYRASSLVIITATLAVS